MAYILTETQLPPSVKEFWNQTKVGTICHWIWEQVYQENGTHSPFEEAWVTGLCHEKDKVIGSQLAREFIRWGIEEGWIKEVPMDRPSRLDLLLEDCDA